MDLMRQARAVCREIESLEKRLQALTAQRQTLLRQLAAHHTQREIATQIGISQPRVCQLLKQ